MSSWCARRIDLLVEVRHEHPGGEPAERDVDEEDPAPAEVLGEHPAEGRADHRGGAPDAGDVALHPGPLLDRVEVADHGDGHRQHRAGADALHGAGDDQRRHAPGHAAQHRAGQEHGDAEEQHRPAADDVGELAVERGGDGLGQQVDGEQPGELREPARGRATIEGTAVAMIVASSATSAGRQHQRERAPARARSADRRRRASRWRSSSVPTEEGGEPFPGRQLGPRAEVDGGIHLHVEPPQQRGEGRDVGLRPAVQLLSYDAATALAGPRRRQGGPPRSTTSRWARPSSGSGSRRTRPSDSSSPTWRLTAPLSMP